MHFVGIHKKNERVAGKRTSATGISRFLSGVALCALSIAFSIPASPVLSQTAQAGRGDISQMRRFNIPAQGLTTALAQFGRQSGLQVAFPAETPGARTSNPVNGEFSPNDALSILLNGTGLSWEITAQGSAIVFGPGNAGAGDLIADGDSTYLDPIFVVDASPENAPYKTSGSVSHVSREQIDRIPPTSPGDLFVSTPGVLNAGNRVGTSINPNIRGLQGMGRVKVTVDGTQSTSSSYRGYIGNRDETFIDPEMIGGADIVTGPGGGVNSAIGGTVAIRTLLPEDIIKDGKTWGARFRAGGGNNTVAAPAPGTIVPSDRPGFLDGDSWLGSAAVATATDRFEALAAYSKRDQGNYFAGTDVPEYIRFPGETNANTVVPAGGEVFNTSEETQSILVKGKLKWGDEQSLALGYSNYDSKYGEIFELQFAPWYEHGQDPLYETQVNTYTARYRWEPSFTGLANISAGLWYADLFRSGFKGEEQSISSEVSGQNELDSWGTDITNTALFDAAFASFRLDSGLEFVNEDAATPQTPFVVRGQFIRWTTPGPSGTRQTVGAFSNLTAELTDWLSTNGGLRYDYYRSEGSGYLAAFPENSGSGLSPRFGVTLTPVDGVQFFAQYDQGFRPPSLRETHWNYQNLLVNNPDLGPETAGNWEFGFNILRDGIFTGDDSLRFKAVYFDNRYSDYIVRAPVSGPGTGTPYQWTNIDSAQYAGFELSGIYDADYWFLEGAFTRYRTIEYCAFEGLPCGLPVAGSTGIFNDYQSNYVPPGYSGSVTGGVRLFDRKLTLGGRAHFAGVRFGASWEEDAQGIGLVGSRSNTWPQYTIFNAFGNYNFNDNAVLNVSVENITDQYYFDALASTTVPSPGRTARASFTLKF